MPDISYRRNLPHIHPDGYPLFITFRLAETLPKHVIVDLQAKRERELHAAGKLTWEFQEVEDQYFNRYDEWLDNCSVGPRWLERQDLAKIVSEKILEMSTKRFKLFAYCVMPNHVHLLLQDLIKEMAHHHGKSAKYSVTETLRLLKGNTARFCNQALCRSGQFWHAESYDHVVRTEEELERIIRYILNNPVRAGLVKEWKDWKFAYVDSEFGDW
jgi:putative transposase